MMHGSSPAWRNRTLNRNLAVATAWLMTWSAFATYGAESLVVDIPQIGNKQVAHLAEARTFVPRDWQAAARISLFTDAGEKHGIPEETTAYLFHDGTTLYAAIVCSDRTMSGRALPRQYGENLTQDEAVQILLGTGEEGTQTQIEFGGYEAAQGLKLPPVAHFYEFTANMAGSISRRYNETLLPQPRFQVSVTREKDRWIARFRIPLSSAGIAHPVGKKIYFNLFRFYRAERYGFYYPGFGGYRPMPFATAVFLPAGLEGHASDIAGKTPAATDMRTEPAVPPRPEIEYYPLARKVCAKFPARPGKPEAELTIEGTPFRATVRLQETRPSVVTLPLPKDGIPDNVTAVARIQGEAGQTTQTFSLYRGPTPEWYGTKAGLAYVDEKVPYPWTRPVVQAHSVRLAHADIAFGATALPAEIIIAGRPLLAGPVTVDARMGGQRLPVAALAEIKGEPTRVWVESEEMPKGVQLRTMVDFDGFMVIRLRLRGLGATALEHLDIHVPLAAGVARYVNRGSVQDTLAIFGGGYAGNASPLWVGNAHIGLAFSYDRPCFFSPRHGRQLDVVPRPNGMSELIIHLVDGKGRIDDEDQVFQFFLQGTPFRRDTIPPLADSVALWFENWSDYQGYPDLMKLPEVKKHSDEAHREGKLQFLYFSQCLAENSPGFREFRNDWIAPPDRPWYRRSYDPGKGVPCHVCCFRGAAGDLLLDAFQRLADEADLDGVYFDGTGYPFSCESIGHPCSDSLPVAWDDDCQNGRILGLRRFLKRTRGIFTERGRKTVIWAHNGGGLNLATLALCDIFYEGEQLSRYHTGYIIDPATFLIGYSGKPFGFRTLFLPVLYFDAAGDIRTGGALGLLHDVESSFGGYKPAAQDIFFDLRRKRDPTATFYGYWRNQPHIDVHGDLPVSYYRGQREAMLVVGNLKYEGTKTVRVDLKKMFDTNTVDVLAYGAPNTLTRGCTELEAMVEEGGYRVFRITPPGVAPDLPPPPAPVGEEVADFQPITAFDPNDWNLAGKTGTLPDDDHLDLPYLRASVKYSTEVTAQLKQRLPRDFTMKMRFASSGVFRLKIDEVTILCDGWTPWKITGVNTLDPVGVCVARPRTGGRLYPPVKSGQVIDLLLVCHGDRLSVLYDGKFLLDRMRPSRIHTSHVVQFATWGGRWMGLDVVDIHAGGNLPTRPRLHPVR